MIVKTSIYSESISADKVLMLDMVSICTLTNYGDTTMSVTIDNVTEEVPAFDATNQYARSFVFGGDSTFSDLKAQIKFQGGSGKAVLRARIFASVQEPEKPTKIC